jgi:beta-lactam-binding protein with PASTA domain
VAVPLIDGKYEILRQRPSGEGRTVVHATDPDGRPVRIVWYDVPPEAEAAFERYRRALRRLAREPDVLLREVVSRPGARYVVWEVADGEPVERPDATWRARLERAGLPPEGARLLRRGRTTVLTGLGWGAVEAGGADEPASRAAATERRAAPRAARPPSLGPAARTWLLGALLSLAAVALALAGWLRADNDTVVEVPDLAGRSADAAAERLAELRLQVEPRALPSGGPAGTVLATDPAPGALLRPGRTVRLAYVRPRDGAIARTVPTLTGRPRGTAEERLAPVDLRLGDVARVPARLPAGTVLAQRPAAGATAAAGDAVHLLVSDGPQPARSFLPDLVGRDLDEARALARLAGLPADRVRVDRVARDDVPVGRVVGMTPAPWHPLRVEDVTLRLLVADPSGAAPLDGGGDAGPPLPDVVGLPLAEARRRLLQAGRETRVERTVARSLPDGVVLQDPAPGTTGGTPVRLLVNARPVALPRPEPVATILAPRLRWVPYRFLIEPGIPAQTAVVRARTAAGDEATVLRREVVGGDVLEGAWPTLAPGPVTFELSLNDVPYADQRVTREVDGP